MAHLPYHNSAHAPPDDLPSPSSIWTTHSNYQHSDAMLFEASMEEPTVPSDLGPRADNFANVLSIDNVDAIGEDFQIDQAPEAIDLTIQARQHEVDNDFLAQIQSLAPSYDSGESTHAVAEHASDTPVDTVEDWEELVDWSGGVPNELEPGVDGDNSIVSASNLLPCQQDLGLTQQTVNQASTALPPSHNASAISMGAFPGQVPGFTSLSSHAPPQQDTAVDTIGTPAVIGMGALPGQIIGFTFPSSQAPPQQHAAVSAVDTASPMSTEAIRAHVSGFVFRGSQPPPQPDTTVNAVSPALRTSRDQGQKRPFPAAALAAKWMSRRMTLGYMPAFGYNDPRIIAAMRRFHEVVELTSPRGLMRPRPVEVGQSEEDLVKRLKLAHEERNRLISLIHLFRQGAPLDRFHVFMDLPPELRDRVYEMAMVQAGPIVIGTKAFDVARPELGTKIVRTPVKPVLQSASDQPRNQTVEDSRRPPLLPGFNLILVSKQVRNEATTQGIVCNIFQFKSIQAATLFSWLSPINSLSLRQVALPSVVLRGHQSAYLLERLIHAAVSIRTLWLKHSQICDVICNDRVSHVAVMFPSQTVKACLRSRSETHVLFWIFRSIRTQYEQKGLNSTKIMPKLFRITPDTGLLCVRCKEAYDMGAKTQKACANNHRRLRKQCNAHLLHCAELEAAMKTMCIEFCTQESEAEERRRRG